MKIILFIVGFFLSVTTISAQIVNIPDAAFKALLVNNPSINTNGDGDIQENEASAITILGIYDDGINLISDLTGIRSFTNLDTLYCDLLSVTNLDLSNLPSLAYLNINSGDYYLTTLNISGCDNLQQLVFAGNVFSGSSFTAITFGTISKLKTINIDNAQVEDLDLRNFDSLSNFTFHGIGSYIGTLNVSGLTLIDSLDRLPKVGTIIAKNCTALKLLHSEFGAAGVDNLLDVTGCINLESIYLSECYFTTLDLSSCINLHDLKILSSSPGLQFLNIKNGSFATIDIEAIGVSISPVINICTDDFETDTIIHYLQDFYPSVLNAGSFCSLFPGGNYNIIKGKVRLDFNGDGCDNADAGMAQVPVRITDNTGSIHTRYTAPSGNYADYPYAGSFSIAPYFPYPYFNLAPASANIVFDTANNLIDSANFCITPNGMHRDLDITLLPITPARPGFGATYNLIYKNKGTAAESGSLLLNYNNSKMNFNSASTTISSQSAGQLVWNYSNLSPFESRTISVSFDEFAPPVNNIGDTLIYLAVINPVNADETPGDNSFILPQNFISSFDPNAKQCLEGKNITYDDIDKSLHYLVRFQNTGTDTAFNVVVVDSLSDKFDWNSVEIISTSHPCDIQQKNGKLEFYFQNIKLPYAAINEPGSHGYVAFSIKPKSAVTIGDSLNNCAAIYFDFNVPVITNTATTVVSPASPVPVKLEYFSVSRKDATNILTWKAPSTSGSTIFNIERSADGIHFSKFGEVTATAERSQLPFNFTDAHPLTGKNYYRLKITDADGISFYSKILSIGNNKSGLDITAVTSDLSNVSVYLNSDKDQTIQMKIIAVDGKLIYSETKSLMPGSINIVIPIGKVCTAVYTLLVYTKEGYLITKRFVK